MSCVLFSLRPRIFSLSLSFSRSIAVIAVGCICLGLHSGVAQTAPAPTTITVGTTVKMSHVRRLGMNIGNQAFYDSQQLSRNIMVRNPGFEGEMWQSTFHCTAVTATTCRNDLPSGIWPANFFSGATAEFITGGALGAKVGVTASTAPNSAAGIGVILTFATPPAGLTAGDYAVVRMQVPGNAQAGWWTAVSGGGALSTEFIDLSPQTPGLQALRMDASGPGESASVSSFADSSPRRALLMEGGYTLTFRGKGTGGANTVTVTARRLGPGSTGIVFFTQTILLNNSWHDFSYSFQANDQPAAGALSLSFTVAGSSMLLDDVALTADAASDNPTIYRNEVVAALRSLNPGTIRYMDSGTNFGSSLDNMLAPQFARQRSGFSAWSTEEDDIPQGLHDFLTLCQAVGAEPWYTVQIGTSTQEMADLIEYLSGSASTPYGAKRAALGQTAPWTSVFPTIHLELGNEVWNTGFSGAVMLDPVAYGQRAGAMFGVARSSPTYVSSSFDLVLDGFAVLPFWNKSVLAASSNYDSIDVAPYLFSTFNDDTSTENIFGPMMAQPEALDSVATGTAYQQAVVAAGAKLPAKLEVYESNLSTVSGTATQADINSTVPSLGAGLAATEHMLLMMRDLGVNAQNMFTLGGYSFKFASATPNAAGAGTFSPLWGTTVDMGGVSNRRRPPFLAAQLANAAILPTMLNAVQSGANPTWAQPLSSNDNIKLASAHYIQSFAFTDGVTDNLVLFNLSRTSALPVAFAGLNAPLGAVNITTLTSQSITDNNETSQNVAPSSNSRTLAAGATLSLPAYSMTVISSTAPPAPVITGFSVSCGAQTLPTTNSTSCSAAVSGTSGFNPGVTWAVNNGSITSGGVYTAPLQVPSSGTAVITATSQADATKTASATIALTLTPSTITSVTAACAPSSVVYKGTTLCTAAVAGHGAFSSAFTWTAVGGSIDSKGNVTAPASGASISVVATSVQDATKTATVSIKLLPPPPTLTVPKIAVTTTTATITWTSNMATENWVGYGTANAWTSMASSTKITASPTFTLTGLKSGTKYLIAISSKNMATGQVGTGSYSLTTH